MSTQPTYYFFIARHDDGSLRVATGRASSHLTHDRLFTYDEIGKLMDIAGRHKNSDMACDDIRTLCVHTLDQMKKGGGLIG